MKNKLKEILLITAGCFALSGAIAQNASLNMLVLNSGFVPIGGNGTLQATINATTGSGGQMAAIAAGKINLSVSVPPSLLLSATQSGIPAGWTIRNNDGTVINLCNSTATIALSTAINIQIDLQGITPTTGAPTIAGQLSFKTNCSGPGSLSGDNPSDNSGQAGFSVTGTTPVELRDFNALLVNCQPVLNWVTESEINSSRFEIEKSIQNTSAWAYVGKVIAGGNSIVKTKYSFIDENITASTENIFYRLKMIDIDGHYKYSDILPVYINCKINLLNVYPNPVQSSMLYISITGLKKDTEANLISVAGQVALKAIVKNGTNKLNIENIASGQYILKVDFENGDSKKVKVIINN